MLAAFFFACPAADSQVPSGKDVVAPTAFVSFDPVARGMSFQVAVVLKIRPGFHVNARAVTESYLIPTDLHVELPAGLKIGEIVYPKGTLHTFAFSKNKQLNVYTDSVIVRVPLTALPNSPLGAQRMTLKVRYQACSTEICLPPTTKEVEATINIVADRSAAKPAGAEIFGRK